MYPDIHTVKNLNQPVPPASFFDDDKLSSDSNRRESALLDTTTKRVTVSNAQKLDFEANESKLYSPGRMKKKSDLVKRLVPIDWKMASRMSDCSDEVFYYRPVCGHETKSRIFSSRHCGIRICPVCARKRFLKLQRYFVPALKKYIEENHLYPYLVTTTLKDTLTLPDHKLLKRLYYNLLRHKFFEYYGLDGWYKKQEVVIGKGSGMWHVHDHALMLFKKPIPVIKSGPKAGHAQKAVNQALSDCWRKVTGGVSYIVDIEELDGNYNELIKYLTKSPALFNDRQLAEFIAWQKHQPATSRGGSLRGNAKIKAAIKEAEDLDKVDDPHKIVCETCGETRVEKVYSRWNERLGGFAFHRVMRC